MPAITKPEISNTLAELKIEPLAHRMAEAYWRALKAEAEGRINGLRHALREKEQLLDASPASLEWRDLSYAEQTEPGAGFEVYDHICKAARIDLESGERAADVVGSAIMRPWAKARYFALRESFIEDWKPTGSIETRLIEMMAQLYTEYEHWMELSVQRAAIDCHQERYEVKERGKWRALSVAGDAEVNKAAEMADRFNRLFLRTLRQLRDLRRYVVPVTINNPQQVNIAAEGGQQVNLQSKSRNSRMGTRGQRPSKKTVAAANDKRVNLGKARKVKAQG